MFAALLRCWRSPSCAWAAARRLPGRDADRPDGSPRGCSRRRLRHPGSESPYDFAPGMPYFAAAVYWLLGNVDTRPPRASAWRPGTLAVLVVFLIGRRLGEPLAG
jgi:hypothetical protein